MAALGIGDDLTMRGASSPLIPVLGRLAVLRQLLAAYLDAGAQCSLLRIAATSSSALTTLLSFRSRAMARVGVFDKHLAEVKRPAGMPAKHLIPRYENFRTVQNKLGHPMCSDGWKRKRAVKQ